MRYRCPTLGVRQAVLAITVGGAALCPGFLAPAVAADTGASAIIAAAGGHATATVSPVTGTVAFVSIEAGHEIQVTGDTPQQRAISFVLAYPGAFGIASRTDLWAAWSVRDELGLDRVCMLQYRSGYLVAGSYVIVVLRGTGVSAVAARTIGATPTLDINAIMTETEAAQAVRNLMTKEYGAADVTLSTPSLEVFAFSLVQGARHPERLAWFVEARRKDLRRLVWLDTRTRIVLLSFSQLADARQRSVYDASAGGTWPGALARSENQAAVGLADVDLAYDHTGDFYDYFQTRFGRDGIDGLGTPLRSVVRYCPSGGLCSYPHAFWNGTETVFGEGMAAADDVVAHEWTHALVEKASALLYYGQTGALSESFADLFGELIDLGNGRGDDSPGQRWLIGEDLAGLGPIRDMADPGAFSQPAWTGDAAYSCNGDDGAGVHTNGAVLSHAFTLMADGGTFGDQTVTGIGLDKLARIAYRALTIYLVGYGRSSPGFLVADGALRQSCTDLVGTAGIASADCVEVGKALDAVALASPACSAMVSPPMCAPGEGPDDAFFDNFESDTGLWTTSYAVGGNAWTKGAGVGVPAIRFNENPYGGTYSLRARSLAFASDSNVTTSADVLVPPGTHMQLMHAFGLEQGYDGGVVEYSVDGGAWQDAQPLYAAGADYAAAPLRGGTSGPLAGRRAFTGNSSGYVATQYDLSSLAGRRLRVRFRLGTDSSGAYEGWLIDDVRIYGCETAGTIQMAVATATVNETASALRITVTRTGGTAGGGVVAYHTNDLTGTARAGSDYTSTSGTLTFNSGVMSQSFDVPISNDTDDDDGETFDVELSVVPGGATVSLGVPSITTVAITDDDVAGTFQMPKTAYTVAEGGTLIFAVWRLNGVASGATVHYRLQGETATPVSDYTEILGTLTFGLNEWKQGLSISIAPDSIAEGTETFRIVLEAPGGGATLGEPSSAVVSITDDDVAGVVQLGSSTWTVSEGAGSFSVPVVRSGGVAGGVMVDYATSDRTAQADFDYDSASGTVTFGPNETSKTVSVLIRQDQAGEGPETFAITLSNARGGGVIGTPASAVVTINDDESTFEFDSPTYIVDEAAGTIAVANVIRSGVTSGTASIQYRASDGSAVAGEDYTAPSPNPSTLTFGSGVVSQPISLRIREDAAGEGDQTILLRLVNGTNGMPGARDTAVVVIRDNDVPGEVGFSASAYAFDETVGIAAVPVDRVAGQAGRITVDYHTEDYVGTAGIDYIAKSGTLTFEDGVMQQTILVPIIAEDVPTGHKEIKLYLTNPQGGTSIYEDYTRVAVWDDENSIEYLTPWERNYEGNCANIMVIRGGNLAPTISARYAAIDGTPKPGFGAARAYYDYTPVNDWITIPSGARNASFCVPLLIDGIAEGKELVHLTLWNVQGGYTLGRSSEADLVVIDEQWPGTLSLDAAEYVATEGGEVVVTVRRRDGWGDGVTVQYQVQSETAQSGLDFRATSGTLTFNENTPAQSFSFPVYVDGVAEGAETARVVLLNDSGGVVYAEPSSAIVHILDGDGQSMQFDALGYQVAENGGSVTIRVTRTGSTAAPATVDYDAVAGTGWERLSFTPLHGTVSFAAGQASRAYVVPIGNDTLRTGPRTVHITLANPSTGAALGYPASVDLLITDDEPALTLQFDVPAFSRIEHGGQVGVTVVRSDASSSEVTVDYTLRAGSATPGDYEEDTPGTLTFAAGEAAKVVIVTIADDDEVEPNEWVDVVLTSAGGGATLGAQTVSSLWIVDDDGGTSPPPVPPTPPPGGTTEAVVWTAASGVAVSGNDLTKTAAEGWGNAGAVSTRAIASGDGFVEFTVSETTLGRMVGLSRGNTNLDYTDIDFAVSASANGEVRIYEGGVGRGAFGTYATGDRLRVAVSSGVVRYSRNGTVLYKSTLTATYPLLVDAALRHVGSTVLDAFIAGVVLEDSGQGGPPPPPPPPTPPPGGTTEEVAWTAASGVTVSGNDLTKTAADGWGNAGAVSTRAIASGDGFVEFTVSETTLGRMVGLSRGNTNLDYGDIEFAMFPSINGALMVYEGGVSRGSFGTYATGDHLRVSVSSGVVRYSRNGSVFYTSLLTPTYPLLVDAALRHVGSTVLDAFIAGVVLEGSGL